MQWQADTPLLVCIEKASISSRSVALVSCHYIAQQERAARHRV